MKKLLFILCYGIFSLAMAEDVTVKENERLMLDKFKQLTSPNSQTKKYFINIEKLTLNNNSILLLPEYSGQEVVLNINELVVNGKAVIVQTFAGNFNFEYLDKEIFHHYGGGKFPRAQSGKNGSPVSPQNRLVGDTSKGLRGNDGTEGFYGRSSIAKLTLNVNIQKLSQLYVLLIAESGGFGGKGSAGQIGGNPHCSHGDGGGDGGNGGSGGMGGAPGNSGAITINWTSDKNLKLIGKHPMGLFAKSLPGMVGFPGQGGDGASGGDGESCFPMYKRSSGNPGTPGPLGAQRPNSIDYIYFGNKGIVEINHKGEL